MTPGTQEPAEPPRPRPAAGQDGDDRRLARLRWRCRRGMLENDLILARFLDARGATMTQAEVGALDALLELPDNDLWDLVSGRAEAADPALEPLLRQLRSA
jgi:antitoxin CptB